MNPESGNLTSRIRLWLERGRGESVALAAARIVGAVCALAVAVASARQLGPSARGEIVLVVTMAMIASEVMVLGTDVTGRIQILRRRGIGTEDLLGLTVTLTLFQGVVVGILLILTQELIGTIRPSLVPLGVLLGVSMFQGHMLTHLCFAVRRSLAVSLRDTMVGLVPFVPVFVLTASHRLSVEAVVGLVALGYVVGDVYLWIVVSRYSGPIRFSPRTWVQLLRSSFPVFFSTVAQTAAFRSDRMLLALAVGTTGLGIYSVAATAAEVPRLLLIPVTQVLANRIATGEIEQPQYLSLTRRVVGLYGLLLIGVAVVVPRLIVPVAGAGFSEAESPVVVLAIAEFLLGVHLAMAAVLTGLAHFRRLPVATSVGGLILIVGGLTVVPGGGIMEVAWLRVAAFGVMAAVSSSFVLRHLGHPKP